MTLVWTSLSFGPLSLLCFNICGSLCTRHSATASVCRIGASVGLPSWCRPRHRPPNRLDKDVNLSLEDFRFHRRTEARSPRTPTTQKLLRGYQPNMEGARLGRLIGTPLLDLPMSRCIRKPRQKGPMRLTDKVPRTLVIIKSRMVEWANLGRHYEPVIVRIIRLNTVVLAVHG